MNPPAGGRDPVAVGAVMETASAKVNLRLVVLAREESGYHQIETLFCALNLADTVEVERGGGGIDLEVEGAELGPPEDNLAHRAAAAFYHAAGIRPDVRIRLRKRIPAGAGLGGGSSDAAATLRALDALHDAPLPLERLRNLAAGLGADVPFFLAGSPLALGWGRGERLLRLPPLPVRPVLVVLPSFGIGTADAYADLAGHRSSVDDAPVATGFDAADFVAWERVAALARNDFEPPTFARHPELAAIKQALEETGAAPALLSGSGSALYGVYDSDPASAAAAVELARRFPQVRTIATATRGRPSPIGG